jgi:two-component system sensor histidine kinase PilS (NtrC family)
MDIVIREIDRLNLLITDFLNYAKPEKTPDQSVNLRQILDEVNSITRRHPDVGANFTWNIEMTDADVLGFTEKLKQAFLNIYINAIQAMKALPEPRLDISLNTENSWAVVSVRDYGSGMSEETREKMFEPFHTTKPKGTGLGLAITHKILEVHRASIEVRSELNQGTEFIIKFPLAGIKEESK